jgi:hypothetical protein
MVRPKTVFEASEQVFAEIVVLIKHANPRVRLGRQDVLGVDARFRAITRQERHRPGIVPRVVEHAGAGCDEERRNLIVIEILADGRVGRGPDGVEQERDLLLLDEAAHLLDRLRRAIGVVEADEVDLATIDAALLVDHLEIGGLSAADHAIG